MTTLLDPIQLGALSLPNRIVMAPLTRLRSTGDDERTPNELMRAYYVQRASAGLILTEATSVTPMGVGYWRSPGIWSDAHTVAWRSVTDAVHEAGGRIMLQLWHVGRISHPVFLGGQIPVGPSAIAPKGDVSLIRPKQAFVVPRALALTELPGVVEAYRTGAANAKRAGFDGVELHGANGYLIDQFLQDGSNHRTDDYGGSLENRARFLLEVTDAVVSVWGAGRVGMHLAPRGDAHGIGESNPAATFGHVARELGRRKLAFIAAREHQGPNSLGPALREAFGGVYIANEGFTRESAEKALSEGTCDAVAFGKAFIANPDLPRRFAEHAALNAPDPETFYSGDAKGYTDYPALPG